MARIKQPTATTTIVTSAQTGRVTSDVDVVEMLLGDPVLVGSPTVFKCMPHTPDVTSQWQAPCPQSIVSGMHMSVHATKQTGVGLRPQVF